MDPCDLGPTGRSSKIQVPQNPEQLSDLLKITQPVCSPRVPQHPAHSKDAASISGRVGESLFTPEQSIRVWLSLEKGND